MDNQWYGKIYIGDIWKGDPIIGKLHSGAAMCSQPSVELLSKACRWFALGFLDDDNRPRESQ